MNLNTLVTALVLGSSSAALASPAAALQLRGSVSIGTVRHVPAQPIRTVVRDRNWVSTEWHRDHREPAAVYVEPAAVYVEPAAYVKPARPEPIDDCDNVVGSYYRGPVGRMPAWGHANVALTAPTRIANGREVIAVGPDKGVFTGLTLRATDGATFIREISVDLGDGDVQRIEVNRWLDARGQALAFDIDGRRGRAIVQLTVDGHSDAGSRYMITSER